ncbi:MAG TPA: DUF4917 family protein [Microbacteriaceae bacterium]|nr:DUF4917 family protein [Microbacteriaceae bacterium]
MSNPNEPDETPAKAEPSLDNGDLLSWDEAKDRAEWTGLLVGNGASIAVWEEFAYDSLFERARSERVSDPLTVGDIAVFDALSTTNFEHALASLKTARTVLTALSYQTDFLKERYESIQRALFQAVHSVHLPWGVTLTFEDKLREIRKVLLEYEWIYSLNYDLILYWAVMSARGGRGIVDFFWHGDLSFDPNDTALPDYVPDNNSRIVWLHGGIHLRRAVDGMIYKERASSDTMQNLLDKFETSYAGDRTPLLVSEGTAEDKYRAITRASYLDFALRSLAEHDGGLVVFGCSLRGEDAHLVRAINEQPVSELAVSIRPSNSPATIIQRKAELRSQFPEVDLYFFNSETHPLGDPALRVKRPKLGNIFKRS